MTTCRPARRPEHMTCRPNLILRAPLHLCWVRRSGFLVAEHHIGCSREVIMRDTIDCGAAWNADLDEPFFRACRRLFPPAFLTGASALLASYDDEAPVSDCRWTPRLP